MEQKKKNTVLSAVIYLVIFAVYNLTIFMIFRNFSIVFWVSYGFMIAAFLIHIICTFLVFRNISVKAVFFGIPLLSFSVFFLCAEFFCSIVFMLFQFLANLKSAILIQAFILAVFIIIAIISIMTRDVVQNADNNIKENVSFMKGLAIDIEMLVHISSAPDVTDMLKKLSETIKYSDPMSNAAVAIQEKMIMQYMTELKNAFDANDMRMVKELSKKIELLFIERNKKLMISK